MADAFTEQLRAELAGTQSEIERLENKRRLIQELLGNQPGGAAAAEPAKTTRRRAARRTAAPAPKRKRRPRGLITGKVREYLGEQTTPVHATEILAYLEKNDAAPQSAKPMPTLQSTLQRMKEMGEIVNNGRNRWSLIGQSAPSPAPALPAAQSDTPPVVTSTTTFSSRPGLGQ